jgi:hypothetical protein
MLSRGTTLKKKNRTKLLTNVATSNPCVLIPPNGESGMFAYRP